MTMAALGESITVVNKSGKIVSTSKHLVNVFKEARSAYLEKKAELKAEREGQPLPKPTRKGTESGRRSPGSERYSSTHSQSHRRAYSRDTSPSRYSSSSRRRDSGHRDSRHRDPRDRDSRHRDSGRRDSRYHESRHHDTSRSERRQSGSRRHGDGTYERPSPSRMHTQPISPSHLRQSHGPEDVGSSSESLQLQQQLTRSHSDSEALPRRPSASLPADDMGLAYGEPPPPPLPARRPTARGVEEELHSKMSALTRLLEEANCMQHSARAVVKNLEENPDAMAAVALTLAEISNLAARMAPGALTSFKSSFPIVMGLLASPEFLIAGGVAIGVTVVMFGGYKIIKRIKANKLLEKQGEAEELEEITSDLDRIECWRRGIRLDEDDTMSVATSVDGEFVTPKAGMQLREEGLLAEKNDKGSSSEKDKSDKKAADKEEKKREKREKSDREKQEKKDKKDRDKDKEPSGLLLLFKKDRDQPGT